MYRRQVLSIERGRQVSVAKGQGYECIWVHTRTLRGWIWWKESNSERRKNMGTVLVNQAWSWMIRYHVKPRFLLNKRMNMIVFLNYFNIRGGQNKSSNITFRPEMREFLNSHGFIFLSQACRWSCCWRHNSGITLSLGCKPQRLYKKFRVQCLRFDVASVSSQSHLLYGDDNSTSLPIQQD